MNELLMRLTEPFEPKHITWKPGATKESKCMALAFADLRAYMDRLDEVCGLDWSIRYSPWGDGRIVAELTIAGVTRSSTGEMDTQDEKNGMGGTVAEAQAFKRAATMFGLGRFLYDLPSVWVEFDPQRKRITEAGQKELDTRYATWYAKKKAAQKARPMPIADYEDMNATIDPETGEIMPSDPTLWEKDAPITAKPNRLSPDQMTKLHVLGTNVHNKRWDIERPRLVAEVSNGTYTSAKELTPAMADVLIKLLEAELKHAQQPAAYGKVHA